MFGERLKHVRIKRGYTQDELSLKSGINRSSLAKLECGTNYPTVVNLIKLINALDIESDYLLGIGKKRAIAEP